MTAQEQESLDLGDIFASADATPASKVEFHFVDYARPAPHAPLRLQMVKKHALWGDHLWNGGRWLARHLDSNPELVTGKLVAELGAGAGLPSMIACALGAKRVICTDYPDAELIDNIATNFAVNCPGALESGQAIAKGYLWGDWVTEAFGQERNAFDCVFLCDLIFNHSEHVKLIESTLQLLAPNGVAFCVFTHYRPWLVEKDLAFLRAERWGEAGWQWSKIAEERVPVMFENDRGDAEIRSTVHAYKLERQ